MIEFPRNNQEVANIQLLRPIKWNPVFLINCPLKDILERFNFLESQKNVINISYEGWRLHPFFDELTAERILLEDTLIDRGVDLSVLLREIEKAL